MEVQITQVANGGYLILEAKLPAPVPIPQLKVLPPVSKYILWSRFQALIVQDLMFSIIRQIEICASSSTKKSLLRIFWLHFFQRGHQIQPQIWFRYNAVVFLYLSRKNNIV